MKFQLIKEKKIVKIRQLLVLERTQFSILHYKRELLRHKVKDKKV